jgi:hypothetical protein
VAFGLHLDEHQVFQKCVVSREVCNTKSRESIQKAEFQKVRPMNVNHDAKTAVSGEVRRPSSSIFCAPSGA